MFITMDRERILNKLYVYTVQIFKLGKKGKAVHTHTKMPCQSYLFACSHFVHISVNKFSHASSMYASRILAITRARACSECV